MVPERSLVVEHLNCGWMDCPPPPPKNALTQDATRGAASAPPEAQKQHVASRESGRVITDPLLVEDMEPGCDHSGECSVETLVRRHAEDNTVVVTFGNAKQSIFTENWVYHLRRLGVGGLLVGMMNQRVDEPRYIRFASKLRAVGVGVYTVNSPEVARQPQGGRWFHVLPLIRTGARVLLSDSDVAWLRDPRPYLKRLEAEHPLLDFTVSSDAQGFSDARALSGPGTELRVTRRRRRSSAPQTVGSDPPGSRELDIEAFGHCAGPSMNIGIMHFPPGRRRGTLLAMEEAVAHLASDGNLGRVDQVRDADLAAFRDPRCLQSGTRPAACLP